MSEPARISNISWQVERVQWRKTGEAAIAVVAVFCEPTKLFICFAKLYANVRTATGRMGEVGHITVSGNAIKSLYRYFQAFPMIN